MKDQVIGEEITQKFIFRLLYNFIPEPLDLFIPQELFVEMLMSDPSIIEDLASVEPDLEIFELLLVGLC